MADQALGPVGLTALWNKIKANFGVKLEIEGDKLSLKNAAATPVVLSQVTIPTTGGDGLTMDDVNNAVNQKAEEIESSASETYQTKSDMAAYPTTSDMTNAINAAQVGAAMYKGVVSAESDISESEYKAGWYWVVQTAGTYCGELCETGDMVFANSDKGGAFSADHFDVVQNNIVEMTAAEVEAICTL